MDDPVQLGESCSRRWIRTVFLEGCELCGRRFEVMNPYNQLVLDRFQLPDKTGTVLEYKTLDIMSGHPVPHGTYLAFSIIPISSVLHAITSSLLANALMMNSTHVLK